MNVFLVAKDGHLAEGESGKNGSEAYRSTKKGKFYTREQNDLSIDIRYQIRRSTKSGEEQIRIAPISLFVGLSEIGQIFSFLSLLLSRPICIGRDSR